MQHAILLDVMETIRFLVGGGRGVLFRIISHAIRGRDEELNKRMRVWIRLLSRE